MHAATRREPRTRRARFAAAARARLVDTEEAGALKLHARAGLRVGHVLLHRHLGQRAQRVGVDVAQKVAVFVVGARHRRLVHNGVFSHGRSKGQGNCRQW